MCARRFTKVELGELSVDNFKNLIPIFKKCQIIALNGWGESLVHPEFSKFLEMVPHNGPFIELTSNGVLLRDDIISQLTKLKSTLIISIDGATQETYEQIRIGARFKKVFDKLKTITKIKQSSGSNYPLIYIAFVAMRSNITELPSLIKILSQYSISFLNVMFLLVHGHELEKESLYFYPELYNHWIEKSRLQAADAGIKFNFPGFFAITGNNCKHTGTENLHRWLDCEAPFQTALIKYNGNVMPCCVSETSMGNILNDDFNRIWSGSEYTEFRRKIRTDSPPRECLDCHHCQTQNINNIHTHIKILQSEKL
ncbi:MAG: hypothetical protein A2161_01795 [Candidatus Schekmanbacteria bacterium RBG_13_48_7]|uniref:Uncharacterized protein n=1 Tax=Candidatus Schekmanbacteria bacterium RBG_13_48_7 TaxID=1817878 RepID=A0A1F7RQ95_9BACT|nr:MAG: hypothetical protein A2161_01795 [Candidatus Schekmanbacteria bacterium RBG_13_48_7]